jgi:hypothetical protein
MTLYHGTAETNVEAFSKLTDLKRQRGDLSAVGQFYNTYIIVSHHPTRTPLSHSTVADLFSAGGFYLTDSFRAAGQWACHGKSGGHKSITVIGQSIFRYWNRAILLREYLP